ncbi:MAG TPA: MarR family winged helix-turn-helix transcriptional regulator [Gemmatimonadaceae bacterium]|nr:MarR family winged helix-turn-helix transcriptional regulator [Gemmatimonadaceae bacterium]
MLIEDLKSDVAAVEVEPGSVKLSGSSRPGARAEARAVMEALRRVVLALRSVGEGPARDHGLTSARLFVLRRIAAHPGQGLAELAARTLTRASSVSEVVTRLVEAGLVERHSGATDRRRVELRLTPAGEAMIAGAPETTQERLVAGLLALPDETRRSLAEGFAAWLAVSGLADAPSVMFFEPAPETPPRESHR